MKLLFDESLSPKLVILLRDLFPESESALRNGLAGAGDRRIPEYAANLRSCDYPTEVAAKVIRRNAIRIAELPRSPDQIIVLARQDQM